MCATDCDKNDIVSVGKNSGPVLSRLWTKVHEILEKKQETLHTFQRPCLIVYVIVSISRYSPLSLEVVENRTNVKVFWPAFFSGRTTPTFLRRIVSATYRPPFDKVWLSSVC